MANFDETNQESVADFIIANLGRHDHFVLATVDQSGNPWAVCLNLTIDDHLNIIWKSLVTTEHSQHIASNPDISLCIFSQAAEIGDFGFYAKGNAREVTDQGELLRCLYFRYTKKGKETPSLDNFQGQTKTRIYRAEITEAWINDDRHIKTVVNLDLLRAKMINHFNLVSI